MTPEPTVSVVIPTHNRADLASEAVASVLAQTRGSVEVIVVDDGSTDGTPDALRQAFGDRIVVLENEENLERGATRNRGVEAASGELVAFLDSDDRWHPEKLRRQLAAAPTPSVTGVRMIGPTGAPSARTYRPPAGADRLLWTRNPYFGAPSSLVIEKATVQRVGGFPTDRAVQGSEDWIFLLRLASAGVRPAVVEEPLVDYRVHASNSTGAADAVARSMWAAADWLDEQGIGRAHADGRRRWIATETARRYAGERDVDAARRWLSEAGRHGSPLRLAGPVAACAVSYAAGRTLRVPAAPAWWPLRASWRRASPEEGAD